MGPAAATAAMDTAATAAAVAATTAAAMATAAATTTMAAAATTMATAATAPGMGEGAGRTSQHQQRNDYGEIAFMAVTFLKDGSVTCRTSDH